MTFDIKDEMECISCSEKVKSGKEAMKQGYRVIEYTHEILCERCAIDIQRLDGSWFE